VAGQFEMTGQDDRRLQARNPIRVQAWADPGGAAPALDCLIIDMSPTGACIASVNGASLPDTFSLQLDQKNEIAEAIVMWRVENTVGVKFVKPVRQH
jgi:PilZ domain